jgi:heme-degrading monooxygenase HmoA
LTPFKNATQHNRFYQLCWVVSWTFYNYNMIERQWKGLAKTGEADNYVRHLMTETFPAVSKLNGFIRASILTRPVEKGTEFLIVTVWESIEAIRQFAGEAAEIAVVPLVVREMMVTFDEKAAHYEVAVNYAPGKE